MWAQNRQQIYHINPPPSACTFKHFFNLQNFFLIFIETFFRFEIQTAKTTRMATRLNGRHCSSVLFLYRHFIYSNWRRSVDQFEQREKEFWHFIYRIFYHKTILR